jgi:TRAP-type transport system periplasmic protein
MRSYVLWRGLLRLALVWPAAALLTLPCSAVEPAQTVTLRLAHFLPVTHPMHAQVLQPWAAQVAQSSGGRLRIQIHPAGELGADPAGQLARVESGVVDLVWGLPGYTPERFAYTLLSSLPGYFDNALQATDGLQKLLAAGAQDEYRHVHLLALWANEPALVFTRRAPVMRPTDLAGRVVRHPTTVGAETVQAWGATAARSRVETAATSLREGTIDAAVMDPGAAVVFGVHQEARWVLAGLPSFTGTFFLLANRQRWQALPADMKVLLTASSGRALACRAARVYRDQGVQALHRVAQAGVQLHRADASSRAEFERAARLVRATAVLKLAEQGGYAGPGLRALEQAQSRGCEK